MIGKAGSVCVNDAEVNLRFETSVPGIPPSVSDLRLGNVDARNRQRSRGDQAARFICRPAAVEKNALSSDVIEIPQLRVAIERADSPPNQPAPAPISAVARVVELPLALDDACDVVHESNSSAATRSR